VISRLTTVRDHLGITGPISVVSAETRRWNLAVTRGDAEKGCVSEGGLEPVEPPLDKRVSDILSAKMDPGGPGCTPLFGIGAL
jgi:hypothetical protein